MSQFIHLLKDRTSAGSVILYCSVIAIAIVAAFLSQYSLLNGYGLRCLFLFCGLFLLLQIVVQTERLMD